MDCGMPVLLMLCMLLMLKLRLWEEDMVWVGLIRSNRSTEGAAGAGFGVRPVVMALKKSFFPGLVG